MQNRIIQMKKLKLFKFLSICLYIISSILGLLYINNFSSTNENKIFEIGCFVALALASIVSILYYKEKEKQKEKT